MEVVPGSVWLDARGTQSVGHAERGIARYVREHAQALLALAPELIGWVGLSPDVPVPEAAESLRRSDRVAWQSPAGPPDGAAPSIYHVMSPFEADLELDEIWPRWGRASHLVVTLYDLIPLLMKEQYNADWGYWSTAWIARLGLMRSAQQVLTISQRTAEDAIEHLRIPEERVTVIGSGVSDRFSSLVRTREEANVLLRSALPKVRPGFLLYVGGVDYRKNLEGAIRGYARLSAAMRDSHQLVIACNLPLHRRISLRTFVLDLGIESRNLVLTGFVPDRELAALYRACELFLFPSLYEGAGPSHPRGDDVRRPRCGQRHLRDPGVARRSRGDLRSRRSRRHRSLRTRGVGQPRDARCASRELEGAGRPAHLGAGREANDRGLRAGPRVLSGSGGAAVSMSTALITGVSGQDGSYLAELLLEKGYEVHGLVHGSTDGHFERLDPVIDRITLHPGDLLDENSLVGVLRRSTPDEIYNLAAMSSVAESWRLAVATAEYTAVGVTRLLEGIRGVCPEARFYQASSSEMFGRAREAPQSEATPFYPRSPYGVAKAYGHFITVNYRESFDLHASSGILFNHESPRRGQSFVTRRISRGVAEIKLGLADELVLGNLDVRRDWGYAKEYVEAMWLMLQQPGADDYVIGTGVSHSVRDLVETAFACVGLKADDHVRIDPDLARPADIEELVADASKAKRELGWEPRTSFEEVVEMMVRADLEALAPGA